MMFMGCQGSQLSVGDSDGSTLIESDMVSMQLPRYIGSTCFYSVKLIIIVGMMSEYR